MPQDDLEGAPVGRTQPDGVEVLADLEVAHPILETERQRAGPGRQVEQVGRRQRQPVGAEELLDEVGLQPLLEQEEPGAGADIGAQRHTDAVLDVPAQREQPAAQGGLLVGQCATQRPVLGHQLQLGVGGVDVVGEHAARR